MLVITQPLCPLLYITKNERAHTVVSKHVVVKASYDGASNNSYDGTEYTTALARPRLYSNIQVSLSSPTESVKALL
jgi:hypothetical protein